MAISTTATDTQLVTRITRGDQSAFAELYERYFSGIYDFALRTAHNPDVAADVVQHAFTRAWEHLQQGNPPENVKAWLYTVARNAAVDELRRARRIIPDVSDEEGASAIANEIDPHRFSNPEAVAGDRELVDLVWQAASALNERDYTLLDMQLRRDLTPEEIAQAMGLRRDHVYMLLSRLRGSLEEAVSFLVLMRRGRRACPELDALLARQSASALTPTTVRVMRKHVQSCPVCQEQRKRLTSPAEILAGLALVPAPIEVKDMVWRRIEAVITVPPAAPPGPPLGSPVEGGPWGSWRGTPGRTLLTVAGGLLGITLLLLLLLRPVESAEVTVSSAGMKAANTPIAGARSVAIHSPMPAPDTPGETPEATPSASAPTPEAGLVEITDEEAAEELHHAPTSGRSFEPTPTSVATATRIVRTTVVTSVIPRLPNDQPARDEAPSTPSASATPVPTAPAVMTAGEVATPTAVPSATPVERPSATLTATPTAVPTVAPSATELSAPLPQETATLAPFVTPGFTATPTPEAEAGSPLPDAIGSRPTAWLSPTRTSTRTPTEAPSTSTATAVPTSTRTLTSAPSATSTPTPAPKCPDLSAPRLEAALNPNTNRVAVTWGANGGCAPFHGTITAQYAQQPPYRSYTITVREGSLTDTPPTRCEGTFNLVYTLVLKDGAGKQVTDTATAQINWIC